MFDVPDDRYRILVNAYFQAWSISRLTVVIHQFWPRRAILRTFRFLQKNKRVFVFVGLRFRRGVFVFVGLRSSTLSFRGLRFRYYRLSKAGAALVNTISSFIYE